MAGSARPGPARAGAGRRRQGAVPARAAGGALARGPGAPAGSGGAAERGRCPLGKAGGEMRVFQGSELLRSCGVPASKLQVQNEIPALHSQ